MPDPTPDAAAMLTLADDALVASDYLIDRLHACLRGERVRDLAEAMGSKHEARARFRAAMLDKRHD